MITLDNMVYLLFTVMTLSYLYKENILFRFVEHTLSGIAVGWLMLMTIKEVLEYGSDIFRGNYVVIIGILIGFLVFSRYFEPISDLNRIPVSLILGTLIGVSVRTVVQAQILKQIISTTQPMTNIGNIIMLIMVASAMSYFIFYTDLSKGSLSIVTKFGKLTMMAGFGAGFATLAMAWFSYLVNMISRMVSILGIV